MRCCNLLGLATISCRCGGKHYDILEVGEHASYIDALAFYEAVRVWPGKAQGSRSLCELYLLELFLLEVDSIELVGYERTGQSMLPGYPSSIDGPGPLLTLHCGMMVVVVFFDGKKDCVTYP